MFPTFTQSTHTMVSHWVSLGAKKFALLAININLRHRYKVAFAIGTAFLLSIIKAQSGSNWQLVHH